ncbi:PEPxxWA-CTERM sorting domain-containing protein [Qipengyuania sp.]|uniref:PEPxxWA-CTERM sorting domain-containing protein n=1 Tax=Qipengyuania sp. TaxID=2004515 RepID=UPI0035C7C06C
MKTSISLAVAAAAYLSAPAMASPVLVDPGASSALTTIDFNNPGVSPGSRITDQYAAQGVTLSGGAIYASQAYRDSLGSLHADNFTGPNNGIAYYDFVFNGVVTFAGLKYESNISETTTFQALLNGVVVDSFTYFNPDCCRTPEFVGLTGVSFDTFRIRDVGRRDFYIDDFRFGALANGAVPEPTAWALMILGFGAVGGAMRSRRSFSKVTFA